MEGWHVSSEEPALYMHISRYRGTDGSVSSWSVCHLAVYLLLTYLLRLRLPV